MPKTVQRTKSGCSTAPPHRGWHTQPEQLKLPINQTASTSLTRPHGPYRRAISPCGPHTHPPWCRHLCRSTAEADWTPCPNDHATSQVAQGEKGGDRPHGFSLEHRLIHASKSIHPERVRIYYQFLQHHCVHNKPDNSTRCTLSRLYQAHACSKPRSSSTYNITIRTHCWPGMR